MNFESGARLERVFQRTHLRTPDSNAAPSQQDDPPEDFYQFTAEDYARLQSKKPGEAVMRTRAMREAEQKRRRAAYPRARIRVQFPDLFVVEASLSSDGSVDALHSFVLTLLRPGVATWHLFTAPPKKKLSDRSQSLWEAGLLPQAQVFWAPDDQDASMGHASEGESPFLQEWVTRRKEEAPTTAVETGNAEGDAENAARERAWSAKQKEAVDDPSRKPRMNKPKWLKM